MKLSRLFTVHPPKLYRWLYPGALWRVKRKDTSGGKQVYLTFDDGPCPATTEFILKQLEQFNAKATFFVVGENAVKYPLLINDILRDGHTLGNHTMHHLQGLHNSLETYLDDIESENHVFKSKLFRPPHGFLKMSQYRRLKKKFTIVMFDIVTMDYDSGTSVADIVGYVQRYVRDGSIIVFHDSLKAKERLFEALPQVLQWLTRQGYVCRQLPMA